MAESTEWPWLSIEDGSLWHDAPVDRDACAMREAIWHTTPYEAEGTDLVLEALYHTARMLSTAEQQLYLLVAEARARGASWSAIGKQFGVTRQAAQQRFGAPMSARTIRELRAERKLALLRADSGFGELTAERKLALLQAESEIQRP